VSTIRTGPASPILQDVGGFTITNSDTFDPLVFGVRLRHHRQHCCLTLAQLGEAVGTFPGVDVTGVYEFLDRMDPTIGELGHRLSLTSNVCSV